MFGSLLDQPKEFGRDCRFALVRPSVLPENFALTAHPVPEAGLRLKKYTKAETCHFE